VPNLTGASPMHRSTSKSLDVGSTVDTWNGMEWISTHGYSMRPWNGMDTIHTSSELCKTYQECLMGDGGGAQRRRARKDGDDSQTHFCFLIASCCKHSCRSWIQLLLLPILLVLPLYRQHLQQQQHQLWPLACRMMCMCKSTRRLRLCHCVTCYSTVHCCF
jgi:hypothetical protein